MIDDTVNKQNRNSYRPYYDRQDKCWRVSFPDRDAEEGDLLYVVGEYVLKCLYFPYHTMKAVGGDGIKNTQTGCACYDAGKPARSPVGDSICIQKISPGCLSKKVLHVDSIWLARSSGQELV